MKTFRLSLLLALSAAATVSASAQTRPATSTRTTAKPATTTAKPATTATKSGTTSKSTPAKPTSTTTKAATTTAKPAPKPAPAMAAEEAAPAKTTPEKSSAAKTQASGGHEFGVGSIAANLGVGFGIGYGYYGSVNSLPAMSLSVERGWIEGVGPGIIGFGALVGYKGYTYKYSYGNYKASWNNYMVAVRGTYHYNLFDVPNLDTYAGLSIGARVQTWSDTYWDNNPGFSGSYGSSSTYITSGLFLGGRYMFTNNIGAFGEVGYDMSLLKVGLTARF